VIQQISAEAYVSAYMAAVGYIPKPAGEDYSPLIDRGELWILNCNGRDVGVTVLEERPDHLLVYGIAVSPAEQLQGYGRALLEFAERQAIAIGVGAIRLYTNLRMTGNIALYRQHGYVAVGTRPHPSRADEVRVDMVRSVRPGVS